jgi:hypothetical protein
MMSTVFSLTPSRNVHDVNVKSKSGIFFIIDIYEQNSTQYDSTVTALDNITTNNGSWLYNVTPKTLSANDNFEAAIQLIIKYITTFDKADTITDVHNPCNCPFVSEPDQNNIISQLGVNVSVRVN